VPANSLGQEKYVKGIHQGIVSEADFWRCQEILGKKTPLKSLPNEKVPLRGILRHECGSHITAGYSKGKSKYYLYYRCQKCSSLNIPGNILHEKFNHVLELLSLTVQQAEYILRRAKEKIRDMLQLRNAQIKNKREELEAINKK